ncbi:hypothetical protein SETIT_9G404000v2 [Setaria italica]|uniref:Uncharacterized protein n=1 Tax=Setaria italica TaxID=4555 RepID=A0A368SQU5_SETIT|nr:hypothetical protein SETIT_9G404000v2 [Setaria italica]
MFMEILNLSFSLSPAHIGPAGRPLLLPTAAHLPFSTGPTQLPLSFSFSAGPSPRLHARPAHQLPLSPSHRQVGPTCRDRPSPPARRPLVPLLQSRRPVCRRRSGSSRPSASLHAHAPPAPPLQEPVTAAPPPSPIMATTGRYSSLGAVSAPSLRLLPAPLLLPRAAAASPPLPLPRNERPSTKPPLMAGRSSSSPLAPPQLPPSSYKTHLRHQSPPPPSPFPPPIATSAAGPRPCTTPSNRRRISGHRCLAPLPKPAWPPPAGSTLPVTTVSGRKKSVTNRRIEEEDKKWKFCR